MNEQIYIFAQSLWFLLRSERERNQRSHSFKMVLEIFSDMTTTQYLLSSAFFSVITYWIINNQFSKQRRPSNTKKVPGKHDSIL